LPGEFEDWPVVQYWLMGAVTAVLLLASVLLHEWGHSVVALRHKIPVHHVTLFVFGGVAEIAAEPPSAAAEFCIALAGPVVSLALAAFFALLQSVFASFVPVVTLAGYLAYLNGTLALFDLIAGFPLDGGRTLRAIVWGVTGNFRRATLIPASAGQGIAFLFIVLGVWQMIAGNMGTGPWITFIGWFLESAAAAQIQQHGTQGLLPVTTCRMR
jgi:Zn-dependent protease